MTTQIAVNDIGSAEDFLAAIEGTIRNFSDGDLVIGTVVQIDREEVLLDVGYKTEGVIPSRELSIRHDADPNDIVKVGDKVEALVLQKEDKEGRLILSKKRAQYERAWGEIEGTTCGAHPRAWFVGSCWILLSPCRWRIGAT